MASPRACFSSLPLELKFNIFEHVARQEKSWIARLDGLSDEEQDYEACEHDNALMVASLVSKEWYSLATPAIFSSLFVQNPSDPLFRPRIFPRHALKFKSAELSCPDVDVGEDSDEEDWDAEIETAEYKTMTGILGYNLNMLQYLPNLRSILLSDQAAFHLWGRTLDLDPGQDDRDFNGFRSRAFHVIALKVDRLVLDRFRPFEILKILRHWPKPKSRLRRLVLRQLTLLGGDAKPEDEDDNLDLLSEALASMSDLVDLDIDFRTNPSELSRTWSPAALATLRAADPLPLTTLRIRCKYLHQSDLDFISLLSPTLQHLTLEFRGVEGLSSPIPTLLLPHLITLNLLIQQEEGESQAQPQQPLSTILPAFFSSPLVSFTLFDDTVKINLDASCPLTILGKNLPTLRRLKVTTLGGKEHSLVKAFCAGRNLPTPALPETPHKYHDLCAGLTDAENGIVGDELDGLLEWGKLEVGRLRVGGTVVDSIDLLESFRSLDAHRGRRTRRRRKDDLTADGENEVVCNHLDEVLDWGKPEVVRLRAGGKVDDSVALLGLLMELEAHRLRWLD
ncbi:hypothetical protein RQP46_005801 [Phenoliferia psychrophenolica]